MFPSSLLADFLKNTYTDKLLGVGYISNVAESTGVDGPNSTLGETTNDTEGRVMFSIGAAPYCARTSASMVSNKGVLGLHVFGWAPVVVRRYLDGEQLVWKFADGSITWMDRLCSLPEDLKYPRARQYFLSQAGLESSHYLFECGAVTSEV